MRAPGLWVAFRLVRRSGASVACQLKGAVLAAILFVGWPMKIGLFVRKGGGGGGGGHPGRGAAQGHTTGPASFWPAIHPKSRQSRRTGAQPDYCLLRPGCWPGAAQQAVMALAVGWLVRLAGAIEMGWLAGRRSGPGHRW